MAVHLTDPAVEEEIQAVVAAAPRMTEEQRARLSWLLGFHHDTEPATDPEPSDENEDGASA